MTVDEKLDLILTNVLDMKDEMTNMKSDITNMKSDITNMKSDITNMKSDITKLKDDMQNVKQRLTNVEMTLENVTNRNITIIAEGHLNLARKLDEALKITNEQEMLMIKVNFHEDELRKLRKLIEQTA